MPPLLLRLTTLCSTLAIAGATTATAATGTAPPPAAFNGLGMHLGNLSQLSRAQTRSISPENPTGEKGGGGRATDGPGLRRAAPSGLGQGWKISPRIRIESGKTATLAEIAGPGAIQHIWMTATGNWRHAILRFHWDGEETPSVECPVGDFFGAGWGTYAQLSSLPVAVNPGSAFNCYWEMPFRKNARITLENLGDEPMALFYQVDYVLTEVPENAAYFHAQFRRVNPVPKNEVCVILDGVKGWGHYVGTYLAWGVSRNGWWGEGEIKFYLDGDIPEGVATRDAVAEHGGKYFPTICGTGTEDYFGGSYNFENKETRQYQEFTTPFLGMHQVIRPDGLYRSQQRFGLYRWHVMDPIRFERDLRVTIQSLGLKPNSGAYVSRQDDIASVAFWYQQEPHAPFPPLPPRSQLDQD